MAILNSAFKNLLPVPISSEFGKKCWYVPYWWFCCLDDMRGDQTISFLEDLCHMIFLLNKQHSVATMAPHSSTLAWQIPWAEEPGGLQSMGSLGVGHDWSDLAAAAAAAVATNTRQSHCSKILRQILKKQDCVEHEALEFHPLDLLGIFILIKKKILEVLFNKI